MVGLAVSKPRSACSTRTALAGTRQHVSVPAKRVENGYSGRHFVAFACLLQFDLEGLVVFADRCGAHEILEVNRGVGPVSCHVPNCVHERARTAAIEMGAALFLEGGPKIIGLVRIAIVVVKHDLVGEWWC